MNKKTSKRSLSLIASRSKAIIAAVLTTLVVVSGLSLGFGSATAAPAAVSSDAFKISGSYVQNGDQASGAGSFANGAIADYPEGSCVPLLFEAENNSGADGDIIFSLSYDYEKNGVVGVQDIEILSYTGAGLASTASDLGDFDYTGLSALANGDFLTQTGSTITSSVSGPVESVDPNLTTREYEVTLTNVPNGETVDVTLCARIGNAAGDFGGASMHINADNGDIAISVNKIIELPTLTIEKVVEGGNILAEDFGFVVTDPNGNETIHFPAVGEITIVLDGLLDGDYTIEELGFTGYEYTRGTGVESCEFTVDGIATATLAAGQESTDAYCSFTNSALELPTITVVKEVTNDDEGTLEAEDFTIYLDGVEVTSGEAVEVEPGTYTVTESKVDGYHFDGFTSDCNEDGETTVEYGDHLTCTITNNDDAVDTEPTTGTLIVNKVVINGDGITSDDFRMYVTAEGDEVDEFDFTASGVEWDLLAGNYNVSEGGPAGGFTATFGEGQDDSCDASGDITIEAGETYTCTITNTFDNGNEEPTTTLTVIKELEDVGDSGIIISDFDLIARDSGIHDSLFFSGVARDMDPDDYNVYEESSLDLDMFEATYSGACDENGDVTLLEGQNLTCTITNRMLDIDPPSITVIKTVIGGEAEVEDFEFLIEDQDNIGGIGAVIFSGQSVSVPAGDYRVVELGDFIDDYTPTFGGDCDEDGFVTMENTIDEDSGNEYTCTIINTFNEGKEGQSIIVITNVINDDGGTMVSADTTMEVWIDADDTPLAVLTASAVGSIVASFPGDESGIATEVERGLYDVDASSHADYNRSMSGDCEGSIGFGEHLTCTVTYDDVAQTSGGGGGGGGGGGSCPACTGEVPQDPTPSTDPDPTDAPDPIVLGDTDEQPAVDETPAPPAPEPIVLGATDELPRTGAPTVAVGLITLMSMALAGRRRK